MGGGAVAPEGKALAGIIIRERTTLDLPPGFTLVTLRELGDAFAHAREIAAESGAATIVWSRRATMAEFAIVLEPDEPLAQARRGFYAGMNALADALAARMPPEKPLAFDWPDAIRIDGGLIGGGRLAWPTGVAEHAVPDWLVFGATIRVTIAALHEGGATPDVTALEEEGFEQADPGDLIEGVSRHLMAIFDTWRERGFAPVGEEYLARLSGRPGEGARLTRGIDAAGDLVVKAADDKIVARQSLARALAAPSWLDPATGEPKL
jgi:biotin-(acetyl-CoA carboxylase) ligase